MLFARTGGGIRSRRWRKWPRRIQFDGDGQHQRPLPDPSAQRDRLRSEEPLCRTRVLLQREYLPFLSYFKKDNLLLFKANCQIFWRPVRIRFLLYFSSLHVSLESAKKTLFSPCRVIFSSLSIVFSFDSSSPYPRPTAAFGSSSKV